MIGTAGRTNISRLRNIRVLTVTTSVAFLERYLFALLEISADMLTNNLGILRNFELILLALQ